MSRILQEVELVRRDFSEVEVTPDFLHILVRNFPLPPGVFNRSSTTFLIVVTAAFPTAPPDNFFVDAGLRTASGETLNNYSEPVVKQDTPWGQFSWHPKDWRPAAEIEAGDNLRTFITSCNSRLQEGR